MPYYIKDPKTDHNFDPLRPKHVFHHRATTPSRQSQKPTYPLPIQNPTVCQLRDLKANVGLDLQRPSCKQPRSLPGPSSLVPVWVLDIRYHHHKASTNPERNSIPWRSKCMGLTILQTGPNLGFLDRQGLGTRDPRQILATFFASDSYHGFSHSLIFSP